VPRKPRGFLQTIQPTKKHRRKEKKRKERQSRATSAGLPDVECHAQSLQRRKKVREKINKTILTSSKQKKVPQRKEKDNQPEVKHK